MGVTSIPSRRQRPFGKGHRQAVIDRLIADAEIAAAADEHRARTGETEDKTRARVLTYAHEIVPSYNAYLYHRLAYKLARQIATVIYRVRVGYVDEANLRRVPDEASVVFVINHRSNMDYVLVAFLAAEHVHLSYAVGEWARVWPLDSLLRALGAYFIRRGSRDPLYRKVLEKYVQIAVEHGVAQGVFPEGGLSRDGRLRPMKVGLLYYTIKRFSKAADRDVVFVPVGLNYDRVLEDRTLLLDLDPAAPRPSRGRTLWTTLQFFVKNIGLYLRGRLYRLGYACVNFGPPISLTRYLDERRVDLAALNDADRFAEAERLAQLLASEIAAVIPITPVSLVAWSLATFDGGRTTRAALESRIAAVAEELETLGAHLYIPRSDLAYFVDVGVRMLTLRRLVQVDNDVYTVNPNERRMLDYYANSIAHFFGDRGAQPAAGAAPFAPTQGARAAQAVILVHGLARTARSMDRLARALADQGYEVHNWDYPSRQFGVQQLVDSFADYVRIVSTTCDRVDIVTHSMGGLLARGALANGRTAGIGRLVMLAPPNQGADLASRIRTHRWARGLFGKAIEDLSRGDDLGVAARLGAPMCPFGVIAGTRSFHPLQPTSYYSSLIRSGAHDGTVQVDETRLEGMSDFITVNVNHTFIMDHPDVIQYVIAFLRSGRFTSPS